jgi:DNA ligase-1
MARTKIASGSRAELKAEAASGLLQSFALTAEAVAATTKKLEKARLVGAYLQSLTDADLQRAARYFAGQQFAQSDARTTNVGTSVLRAALGAATGISVEELRPRYVRLGDSGEVAAEAIAETKGDSLKPSLTLAAMEELIAHLSELRGTKNKQALLTESLSSATALEAKYLVKLLAGDLRIGLKEGLVEDAIARAFEQPLARVAQADMLSGDIGETAVRARHGALAEIRMRLFHPLKFMLATAAADLSDVARTMPEEFFVEDKFDGIRAQAHVEALEPSSIVKPSLSAEPSSSAEAAPAAKPSSTATLSSTIAPPTEKRVALFSRTMDDITHRFPELIAPLQGLPTDVILDGEIVPARGASIQPFAELQKRLGRKTVSPELLAATPIVFIAYDVLYAGGRVLVDEPHARRRRLLEQLITEGETLRLSVAKRMSKVALLDAEFEEARARGNEGLMIKDPRASYKPGRRGREWLKLKRAMATLDVVVTSVEVGHGKRRHLLSDYTFAVRRSEEDSELLNVGKAYSGLTDAELAELTEWFRAHTLQEFAHGKVRVVEPQIILEVTFDRVQESKRHKSGYALRFPRILRLREDKTVAEIDTVETVRKLAEGGGDVNA